jgi:hypothetical protein
MLSLLFTGTSSIGMFIGRQQPIPDRLNFLRLTECAPPCWIGIVPGKTSLETAYNRIYEVFSQLPNTRIRVEPHPPPGETRIFIEQQNELPKILWITILFDYRNVVSSIALGLRNAISEDGSVLVNPFAAIPNVAELLTVLGTPTKLHLPNKSLNDVGFFELVYGDDGKSVFIYSEGGVRLTSPGFLLSFYGPNSEDYRTTTDVLQNWRGFRTLDRYYALLPCPEPSQPC